MCIYLFLEGLSKKHFTKENAPFLYKLSKKSINFNKHYTEYPYTKFSIMNLFTGKKLDVRHDGKVLGEDVLGKDSFIKEFKNKNFKLLFNTSSKIARKNSFFDNVFFSKHFNKRTIEENVESYNKYTLHEHKLLKEVIKENKGKNKIYQGYLTYISHWTYYSYDKEDKTKKLDKTKEKYIMSIKKQDLFFKEMFNTMKKEKMLKNTLIVFTADHGQGFGEHGFYTHGFLHNEILHIPMVIYHEGIKKEIKIEEYTTHNQIVPTILHLMDKKSRLNSLLNKEVDKYIISINKTALSAINKETNEKYIFKLNQEVDKCIKYDLIKDYEEKNKIICDSNDDKIIKEIFLHLSKVKSVKNSI